ncbi:hypothetical protein [Nocardia asteroides]|uniref:hypothetical protein n=1 Tax=Nocardia asteroides TaxID=1824 RepID=UPI001E4DF5D4|nr:hypothetical protein [Nocardia asteroides]UGT61104.1 hypothetical protein LTT61_28860 [Nocardia asteroides]
MTAPEEDARVLPLTRPPIRRSVLVRAGRARTWAVFVGRMAEWWRLDPFSAGKARVRDVTVQARVGGTAAGHADRDRLLWEHGRLNCDLREQGLLAITPRMASPATRCPDPRDT